MNCFNIINNRIKSKICQHKQMKKKINQLPAMFIKYTRPKLANAPTTKTPSRNTHNCPRDVSTFPS